jgi:hypothetical protein
MLIVNLRSTPAVATGRVCLVAAATLLTVLPLTAQEKPPQGRLRIDAPPVATDKSIKYDYDIVYVRAPRYVTGRDGKQRQAEVWPNAAEPENLRASTDLMLLHPDLLSTI